MHAAQYTTTPISWRLKRASQATDPRKRKPRSSKMSREELGKARRGAHREREPHTIYTLSSRLRCKGYFVACRSSSTRFRPGVPLAQASQERPATLDLDQRSGSAGTHAMTAWLGLAA